VLPELRLDEETIKAVQLSWLLFCAKKGSVDNAEAAVMQKLQRADPEFAKMLYGAEAQGMSIDPKTGMRLKRNDDLRDPDAEAANYAMIDNMVRNKKFVAEKDPNNPLKGTAFEGFLMEKELAGLITAMQKIPVAAEGSKSTSSAINGVVEDSTTNLGRAAKVNPKEKDTKKRSVSAKRREVAPKDTNKAPKDVKHVSEPSVGVVEEVLWLGTWIYGSADKLQEYSVSANPLGCLTFAAEVRGIKLSCALQPQGVNGFCGVVAGGGSVTLRMRGDPADASTLSIVVQFGDQSGVASYRKSPESAPPSRQASGAMPSRAPRGIVVSL